MHGVEVVQLHYEKSFVYVLLYVIRSNYLGVKGDMYYQFLLLQHNSTRHSCHKDSLIYNDLFMLSISKDIHNHNHSKKFYILSMHTLLLDSNRFCQEYYLGQTLGERLENIMTILGNIIESKKFSTWNIYSPFIIIYILSRLH